jgi:hypothetical protein
MPGIASVERLETRTLLSLTVDAITPSLGVPFSGHVAAFAAGDVTGLPTDFAASINWGDGTPKSAGTVTSGAQGGFDVFGTHTYPANGVFALSVTISGTNNTSVVALGKATVTTPSVNGLGTTITPTAGVPFSSTVATFSDASAVTNAANFVSTIDWGDGQTTVGNISATGGGSYNVVGSHTYATATLGTTTGPAAPERITITIARAFSPATPLTVTSSAVVLTRPFSGRLDPLSDTGPSNSDGITSINKPTISGTAESFAIVLLYSKRPSQPALVFQGQTIASADGTWRQTIGPLADGSYQLFATEIPPGGSPNPMVALPPILIKTIGPQVTDLSINPGTNQIEAVFRVDQAAMDLSSLLNPAHYRLIGRRSHHVLAASLSQSPTVSVSSADPQSVVVTFPRFSSLGGRRALEIVPGTVRDLAGNPLVGDFIIGVPNGKAFRATRVFRQAVPNGRHVPIRVSSHV